MSGPATIINMIRIHASHLSKAREPIGPVCGPYKDNDYLNDPLSSLFLMKNYVFDEILEATGNVPIAPDVPDGTIA